MSAPRSIVSLLLMLPPLSWLLGLVGGMMQGSDLIALNFSVLSIFALVIDLWEVGVILRQKRNRTRGASLFQ